MGDVVEKAEPQKQLQPKDLEEIRGFIRKAAEVKDPRELWFTLRDIMNLLTLLIVPEPEVILPGDV